ncbi:uncharacterized protein LOC126803597 [Argentina anserina]|uniref:uncharacterized protein LOC126803597 n=1 Tax=Argentina anserina TaxID=57926 RepID=UPI0021767267|nr:uncharacterized protein LOC126803597 [Potentilla anserina]
MWKYDTSSIRNEAERHWLEGEIADIRNVGRIVVEMLRIKPWSQHLEKVIIAEPPTPARDFMVKCRTWLPNSKVDISDLIQDPFINPQVGASGHLQHAAQFVKSQFENAKQTGYSVLENVEEKAAQTSQTFGQLAGSSFRRVVRITNEFGVGFRKGKGEGEEEQKQNAPANAAKIKASLKVPHVAPKVEDAGAKFQQDNALKSQAGNKFAVKENAEKKNLLHIVLL